MQTKKCGKYDILPVADNCQDHARMPVMLPREFDADMRRDGSMTGQPVQNQPSMSAEECTACQDPVTGNGFASARDVSNLSSQRRVKYRKTANRRRRWPIRKARNQNARLGGQDKSSAVLRRADGWFPWRFRAARHIEATALPTKSRVFSYIRTPSLRCNTGKQVRE